MAIISPQQILIPKKVYIGDTAELRCTFNSPSLHLKELTAGSKDLTYELPLVSLPSDDYEIKSISLSSTGVDFYQLSLTFTPWKTGSLQFPPLELEAADLVIEFQPVQIVSLVSTDSNSSTSLRETAAPLLLPGTAYKLYGALTLLVILLIVVLQLFLKRKQIAFYLDAKRLQRKYKKNKRQTLHLLRQIENESKDSTGGQSADSYVAEKLQKIMRNYLEVRFDYPFTRAATSELMQGWQAVTRGLLSDEKEEAFCDIASSFVRTDYIRYSSNASFEGNEKKELIEKLIKNIELLEKEDNPKGDSNA